MTDDPIPALRAAMDQTEQVWTEWSPFIARMVGRHADNLRAQGLRRPVISTSCEQLHERLIRIAFSERSQ